MAYKYKERYLKVGRAWQDDDGFKHPYNWSSSWSADDLKKWGVTVEADVDTSFDDRFYWAKGIERKLADENVVDKDGKAVIDSMTGKQMVQLGLKSIWVAKTKTTANSLLSSSDWYVTRKAEADTAIPSDISKYRTDVRTASKTIEDKINNCKTLSAFQALFLVPKDSNDNITGNAPINDFPDEV
ncbi:hypothetical protein [uncultured Mediterranean phage uvMED]|uniref:Uncharacterized protein n=1 Tax=uncultured organism MedDCM-OCT-S09-C94 TaxID=743654 RepID=D6PL70_9ZZZZ|nr:hypothetical protein [uncultured organism MedDCM-OCT-S09-C94]BAQ91616.1 hypothetical protein [uncultured Mediterranean phage uvMED]BAQ91691.1 hypothetical protein [uncultured Mediterranean phage uvMED]BAQ91735.1 hypothetical protein [uncultured Mediterranean phage uvMED]BAQ91782.1 hypothetical protein [uncultured Mediterranean phage uvMED]